MLYSIGNVEEPKLNIIISSSLSDIGIIPLYNPIFNQIPINYYNFNRLIKPIMVNPFFQNSQTVAIPKKEEAKIETIEKKSEKKSQKKTEKVEKKKKIKKIFEVFTSDTDTNTIDSEELNFITENDITKFNNDLKMKKIHSTYLLKKKVSTKFRNQVRVHANCLIQDYNKNNPNGIQIPLLVSCTKIFREDVKINTFQKIKNCTIDKFINEDIQQEGRSLNMKNFQIIELIKKIAEKNEDNVYIKNITKFLFKTIVIEYYNDFLKSNNYKSCLKKDLRKYTEKLKALNYTENKIQIYKKIFRQKYDGIAKYLFDGNYI